MIPCSVETSGIAKFSIDNIGSSGVPADYIILSKLSWPW